MPAYRVKRTGLVLSSMLVDAPNSAAALRKARENFARADQRNTSLVIVDDAYDQHRDELSERRYTGSTGTEDDRARRWQEGAVSDSEAIEPW